MQYYYLLIFSLNLKFTTSLTNFDLTYTIRSINPVFPGLLPFNFTQTRTSWNLDNSDEYYFKSINTFETSEHYGTHIDAPYHGSNTSWTVEQIPLKRLVSIQALIVDVSKKSSRISNYQIQVNDLNENIIKQANGYFVLLFYTGKSKYWPDQQAYAGGYTREELDFAGLSPSLASYLVEKYSEKLVGVGIDTLSIDPGSTKHFNAHRIFFKQNIYVLENVAELDRVLKYLSKTQQTFFAFDVLPMKIEDGTGAPCRLLARLETVPKKSGGWFGFLIFCFLIAAFGILAKSIYALKYHPEKNFV